MKKLNCEDVLKEISDTNIKIGIYIDNLNETLKSLNDQNVLHTKALEMNTQAIQDVISRFVKLLLILVGALIVLAGAEKIFTLSSAL